MRQKIFIKQTCRALLLYFICLTIAVAIDLIFFKVKNMYHTPALVAIFSGWVYLGLIQKTKQFGAVTALVSLHSSSLPLVTLFLTFLPSLLVALALTYSQEGQL